jgi:regulator of PEP synthase PpsR (kinase-PPPase family)
VKHAANTAIAQFREIEVKKYHWPLIKNEKILSQVFDKIKVKPGVILYTISNESIREKLKSFAVKMKLPCVSVVSKIVNEISEYTGIKTVEGGVIRNRFDDSYFDKVDALQYTLKHDDGQIVENLESADIILIGPSRTSKTPTSVYLAYNGLKTANIPYILNHPFPSSLFELKKPVIFGLVINPVRLIEIRESRMNLLQMQKEETNYTNYDLVKKECLEVKKICTKNNWHTIDVSRRSIEETAAIIMKLYFEIKKS